MAYAFRDLRTNRLLASLPPDDGVYLASLSRIEHAPPGRVLSGGSEPGTEIWFPHSGAIALINTDASGRSVQTGIVGSEGCVGLEALFGQRQPVPETVVQIGGRMSVIPAIQLRTAVGARPWIHAALSTFLYDLSAQSLQTIACNRLHRLLPRCCRWLLAMQDKAKGNDIPITQENLATLLGSGRPRINLLLATLEKDGILRRSRGRIRLLTRAALERHTCECYYLAREDISLTQSK
jgi:CRP-like cAMP-binding protein